MRTKTKTSKKAKPQPDTPAVIGGLPRYLKRREVLQITGWSPKTLYREIVAGRFPKPEKLSPGRVGWRSDKVRDWQESRPAA